MADVDFHSANLNEVSLEGDITVPGAPDEEDELSTLDEPVRDTIMRDVHAVGVKIIHVFYPKQSTALLRDWDLWGPMIISIVMSALLHDTQFTEVFVVYWIGAFIVTLNSKLLGGTISFFQSVCVLGYCVLPLCLSLFVCWLISFAHTQSTVLFVVRMMSVLLGFSWSSFASTAFLADSQPERKKTLAMYPIVFFYFVISWIIISDNPNR